MRLNAPRWLLICEALILLGAILFWAYKAATRTQPLPVARIEQKRGNQKPPQGPTILDYYRQYPDRYIRVDNESWVFDAKTLVATHSFSLRNLATVPYKEIEMRFTYESSSGKSLLTRDMRITGQLQAQGTLSVKNIKVTGVPATAKISIVVVGKALMIQ